MTGPRFVPLDLPAYPEPEMEGRAAEFSAELQRRRSVRQFSERPVPRAIIEHCLRAAASAPSGANMQPWHFVAVADAGVKRRIRAASEAVERELYRRHAPPAWLQALAPLGTGEHKPFLETAPWLIAVFVRRYGLAPSGETVKHYYAQESVGIATGLLLAAVHHAGLAALTYTPSPMGFLNGILGRPESERPFLLLVVGYPAAGAVVPDLRRKTLAEVVTFVESGREE